MGKWITATKGVRYRKHATRKHGVRYDRYWVIYFRLDGKRVEEALGWSSEGWNQEKAVTLLSELKENQRKGLRPRTLREKRKMSAEAEAREAEQKEAAEKKEREDSFTFNELFENYYLPYSKENRKTPRSIATEKSYHKKWIKNGIGKKPLKSIAPLDLERLKQKILKAKKAPRTCQYILQIIRQAFNYARRNNLFFGENPVSKVKFPTVNNRRMRYLTTEESETLLEEIKARSLQTHDICLLSLNTGMRAGELFSLKWGDVDLDRETLIIRDPKNNQNRHAYLNDRAKKMFLRRKNNGPHKAKDFVFIDRNGKKTKEVSNVFMRAVDKLGLNKNVVDKRDKLTFHCLRHSFASQLIERGVDLYTIKELLGHRYFQTTARYSHLSSASLKEAVGRLEQKGTKEENKVIDLNK